MSDSHTTATPETKNAAPTAHPPVRETQRAVEAEVEQGAIAGQRVMRAIGGGSPETPPEQFSGALGQLTGRSQSGMLRQLQRSYGNSYVGSVIQRKADGNGACTDCEKKEKEIQRKGEESVDSVPDGFEATMQRSGSGQPLDEGTRSFMESRFGQDFGDVQVHTDSSAADAAKQIQAQAFTTERDIYFGRGYYQPQSHEGQKLIAHELTHTVQQRNNVTSLQNKAISGPNDAAEREAEGMSESLTSQMITPVSTLPNAVLQRQESSSQDSAKDVDQITIPAGVIPTTGLIKKTPPGAGTETITFEGVLLSTNTEFVRWQLEQMIVSSGESSTESFVNRLVQTPQNDQQQLESNKKLTEDLSKYGSGDVSGAPLPQSTVSETEHRIQNQDLTRSIAKVVQSEFEKLQNDNKKTLSDFEHEGEIALSNMLIQSESRVMTEASHYGIPPEVIKKTGTTRTTAFPPAQNPYDITQQNANQQWEQEYERRREVQGAASRKKLIEAAQALQQALQKKRAQITKLKEKSEKTEPGKAFPSPQTALDMIPLINAQEEYNKLRREKEAEFPILAVYAQEGGNLGDIINPGNELKNVLAGQLAEKFEKIQTTETYVSESTITMWDVPVIVEGARVKLKIDHGTMQWRVIQDKANTIAQAKQDAKETKEAIGTIALILGLLAAVPTGGGSLAVVSAVAGGTSAVLGAYVAGSDLQEYMVQAAASGSDFDRARAISQEDPSLFWVALGVVGSILDVGMALKTFQALSGLRRAVVTGEQGAEALLRAEGNRVRKQLGDQMVSDVEKLGQAGAKDAKGVAQVVDKEVLDTTKLAEAAIEGVEKHEIIVTKNGAFRCSKKCGNIFWLYQDVLEAFPSMKPRLEELVKLGDKGAPGIAKMTQRMERLREISLMSEKELELAINLNPKGTIPGDSLRFEQYRRGGGVLEYEEWFVKSQGKTPKGEEAWGELAEELKSIPDEGKLNVDVELQKHSQAPKYRQPGSGDQSAHVVPTSALRDTSGYVRSDALTVLLPPNIHAQFDNYWKAWSRAKAATGLKQVKVNEFLEVLKKGLDTVPELKGKVANTMYWRAELEVYSELGLKPTDLIRLPYSK